MSEITKAMLRDALLSIAASTGAEESILTKSEINVGSGQYRNAVASGLTGASVLVRILIGETDPTLPRHGTDPVQVRSVTVTAKPAQPTFHPS